MSIDLRPAFWLLCTGNNDERPFDGYDNRMLTPETWRAFMREQFARAYALGFRRIILPELPGRKKVQDSWTASAWRPTPEYVRAAYRDGFVAALAKEFGVSLGYYNGGFMDPSDPYGDTNYVPEATKVRVDPAIEAHRLYLEQSLLPLQKYCGTALKEIWVDQSMQDYPVAQRMAAWLSIRGLRIGIECHCIEFNNPQDAAQGGRLINVPYTTVALQAIMRNWDTNKDWVADRTTADRHVRIDDWNTTDEEMRDYARRGFIIDGSSAVPDYLNIRIRAMRAVRLSGGVA